MCLPCVWTCEIWDLRWFEIGDLRLFEIWDWKFEMIWDLHNLRFEIWDLRLFEILYLRLEIKDGRLKLEITDLIFDISDDLWF